MAGEAGGCPLSQVEHQSESIRINQNRSESIKINSESISMNQNQSAPIRINQHHPQSPFSSTKSTKSTKKAHLPILLSTQSNPSRHIWLQRGREQIAKLGFDKITNWQKSFKRKARESIMLIDENSNYHSYSRAINELCTKCIFLPRLLPFNKCISCPSYNMHEYFILKTPIQICPHLFYAFSI